LPIPKVDLNLIGDLRPALGRDEDQPEEQAKSAGQKSPEQQNKP
jgi:hypothetical protein